MVNKDAESVGQLSPQPADVDGEEARVQQSKAASPSGTQGERLSVDELTKGLTFLTVVMYVVGLLIVNSYLYYLGVSDFDLVKPRYVYTGGWLVGTVAVALLAWQFAWTKTATHKRRVQRWPRVGLYGLGTLAVMALVGFAVVQHLASSPTTTEEVAFEDGLLLAALCVATGGLLRLLWAIVGPATGWRTLEATLALVALSAFAGGYLRVFSVIVYPLVSPQFGGGKGAHVQLLLNDATTTTAYAQLSVPFVSGQSLTLPLQLLYEGSDSYTVRIENSLCVTPAPNATSGGSSAPAVKSSLPPFLAQFVYDQTTNGYCVVQIAKRDVRGLTILGDPSPKVDLVLTKATVAPGLPLTVHAELTAKNSCTTIADQTGVDLSLRVIAVHLVGMRPAHAICPTDSPIPYTHEIVLDADALRGAPGGDYVLRFCTDGTAAGGGSQTEKVTVPARPGEPSATATPGIAERVRGQSAGSPSALRTPGTAAAPTPITRPNPALPCAVRDLSGSANPASTSVAEAAQR